MEFETCTHATLHTLHFLKKMGAAKHCPEDIRRLQRLIEDHNTEIEKVIAILDGFERYITPTQHAQYQAFKTSLKSATFRERTDQEKFENPLRRRIESEFAVSFLRHPPPKMMEAVGRISIELNKALKILPRYLKEIFSSALQLTILFGRHKTKQDVSQIMDVLRQNRAEDFVEILAIHFMFARVLLRELTFRNPQGLCFPFPRLAERLEESALQQVFGDRDHFLDLIRPQKSWWLTDQVFSDYNYALDEEKGRKGRLNLKIRDHALGVMLIGQDNEGLGEYFGENWVKDARAQKANFDSMVVKYFFEHDAVYVSGNSGMMNLLLSQMLLIGQLPSLEHMQCYLSACVTYITAGGYHSFHEALAPAEGVLNLVPGYNAAIPTRRDSLPPNLSCYFDLIERLMPDLALTRQRAWDKICSYYFEHHWYSEPLRSSLPKIKKAESNREGVSIELPKCGKRRVEPAFFQSRLRQDELPEVYPFITCKR